MDGSLMLHFDENEEARSPDEILARRLKNRERQRRYRARKRHEADMKNALVVDQSTSLQYHQTPTPTEFLTMPMQVEIPVQVEMSINASPSDFSTRVHCKRDWKKDARSAHIHKSPAGTSIIGPSNSKTTTPGGNQALYDTNNTILDNSESRKLISNRRHWKAEARNKKTSE